jgi:ribose transport system ATP-binding protein
VCLRVRNVAKAFGGTQALAGASFEVGRGTIHALVGGNGSGKSTLIKILAGVVTADAGEIEINGERHDAALQTPARAKLAGLHFVHQQNSTFPDLTVAENLALGRGFETAAGGRIRWGETRRRAAEALRRLQIAVHPDTPVSKLGPATQMMVAIARALQDQEGSSDGILLLDEPTASLPAHEVDTLLTALQRYAAAGQTIVYVTHRLEEVMRVADAATVLRDGHVIAGLRREELDQQTLVSLIMGRAVEETSFRSTRTPGDVVLEARGLAGGEGGFVLRAGEVLGVAGLLGSGRTSMLRQLFGVAGGDAEVRAQGQRLLLRDCRDAMRAGIAYIPEDRTADAAFAELSVKENLSITALRKFWRRGRLHPGRERANARELMSTFRVRAASEDAPLASLSGGNQQKVILARWLQRKPRVLLLDEPTQGVDVGSRAEIHGIVRDIVDQGAGALIVSSDFSELAAVCDRAIVLRRGRVVAEVPGSELNEDVLNSVVYAQGS